MVDDNVDLNVEKTISDYLSNKLSEMQELFGEQEKSLTDLAYQKEELNKSEFYQRLKEQDRAQYLSELEQSRALNDSVIITEDDNKIISSDAQPLRNEAGFFLAVEDPYEDNTNLKDPDQLIKLETQTTTYVYDPYWSLIIDREFKEL